MRTSTLTRAATVATVAAAASLAAAGTASAVTPVVAAKTVLTASASKDVITGTLTAGKKDLAKEVVTLEAVSGKKLIAVGKAVTSKAGKVTFTVKPKATTKYELVFKGAKGLAGSASKVVTIKVAAPKKA
jgi:flagellar capping protein FliD